MTEDNSAHRLWYVRRAGEERGPFPKAQIEREVLLGRIHADDDLSHDRIVWRPLAEIEELQPETPADTKNARQRQRLARLHADERGRDRRGRRGDMLPANRRASERRHAEPFEVVAHRNVIALEPTATVHTSLWLLPIV
ncbi:MAG: DUF4339 domain-containing protein, partial [Gammaproteobacteria bacterium]|nr:DUF4339 domain-containing protein [Gammaproteobacteria bacterium]